MDEERIYRLAVQRVFDRPPDELVEAAERFFLDFEKGLRRLRKHQMVGLMACLEKCPEGDSVALKKKVGKYLNDQMDRDEQGTRWASTIQGKRLGEALKTHLDTFGELVEEVSNLLWKQVSGHPGTLIVPSDQGRALIEYYVLRHFLLNLATLHRLAVMREEWTHIRPILKEGIHV